MARAATLCTRLRGAQAQLAALPAFASAARFGEGVPDLSDAVAEAVSTAREDMPAAVDFCVCFVAAPHAKGSFDPVVPLCQALLPPGALPAAAAPARSLPGGHAYAGGFAPGPHPAAVPPRLPRPGTLVVGCCARGLFGLQDGAPAELDPSQKGKCGATVLLGRLPGCAVRSFQGPPPGGWAAGASHAWLGLEAAATPEQPPLEPLGCLLLAHPSADRDLLACLDGLQAAFPRLLVTGAQQAGAAAGAGQGRRVQVPHRCAPGLPSCQPPHQPCGPAACCSHPLQAA